MNEQPPTFTERTMKEWQALLRQFKEKLAQRLWAIPAVSEAEKELVVKEYLSDMDQFERSLYSFAEKFVSQEASAKEESDLLRSLLGVKEDDLRAQAVAVGLDLTGAREELRRRGEELEATNAKLTEAEEENRFLRTRIKELETYLEKYRTEQTRLREEDFRSFSESHQALKIQFEELETRIANLRQLFTDTNRTLLAEKQEEISLLQKKLLEEMETTLRRRQELVWTEEDLFAKGVAHRVRTALVSAQGQLYLTLERMGLLDPVTKSESTWRARLRLLVEGAGELGDNFRSIQEQFQNVIGTLDEYLHLTGRRGIVREPVRVKELVQKVMAEVYTTRRPTLSVEFLPDDPLPFLIGDTELLQFVVTTLLRNAIEACPNQTGNVVVALKNKSETGQIEILVKDSGAGVPYHLLPRIFQPFFSTKPNRQGLNLSRAKRYVELHGGTLELLGSDKNGTIFQVLLPLGSESDATPKELE